MRDVNHKCRRKFAATTIMTMVARKARTPYLPVHLCTSHAGQAMDQYASAVIN
jgi:hypothetical protein